MAAAALAAAALLALGALRIEKPIETAHGSCASALCGLVIF